VQLKTTEISLKENVLRVTGKGGKTRLIPFGEHAGSWLERYLSDSRSAILQGQVSDALFVTQRGGPMTRQMFWVLIKKHALKAGIEQHLSPHTMRHAFATFAESRGRFACGSVVARSCRYHHYADLHPRRERAPEAVACRASSAWLVSDCPQILQKIMHFYN
jgi:integrase/recombinase XerD